jgi:acetoacetyl-CoA synthetase
LSTSTPTFWNVTYAFVAQIIQVTDIPYTLNGKRVEVLVKKVRPLIHPSFTRVFLVLCHQIINGAPLSSVNQATLTNPECLTLYADIGCTLRAEAGSK